MQSVYRRSLGALAVLVALVLLVACANVANLLRIPYLRRRAIYRRYCLSPTTSLDDDVPVGDVRLLHEGREVHHCD